ncbi:MAG: FAD:protein FMN transferase [Blastocatellia bacterium]|nr:FAD:protein FMN transferase [Blastocatellia bacterium]
MTKKAKKQKRINLYREVRYLMGTTVEILAEDDRQSEADLRQIVHDGFAAFETIERLCNRFDPASEVSRLNQNAAVSPVSVSEELFEIIQPGLTLTHRTNGIFSICLLPLMRLWEKAQAIQCLPSPEEVRKALELSDFRRIHLDHQNRTVFFEHPGMGLDLGGFAKGKAVDLATMEMDETDFSRGLINAGTSSLSGCGQQITQNPWQIGMRHYQREDLLVGALHLERMGLSTSGTGEKTFDIAGTRFSHLLDSQTGFPLDRQGSATALTFWASDAEVASKLILAHGLEKGLACAERLFPEVQGCLLVPDPEPPAVQLAYSEGFPWLPNEVFPESGFPSP